MEIDYRQAKTRTTLEKREHWRKKQQLKDLRSEHDKESKQRKFLKLEVRKRIRLFLRVDIMIFKIGFIDHKFYDR
jgi:hypothetical protein